jgi:Tol biopolymer transport system component
MNGDETRSTRDLPELHPWPDDARATPQSLRQRLLYGCSSWGLPTILILVVLVFFQLLLFNRTGKPPRLWPMHTPTPFKAVVDLIDYQEPNLLIVVEEGSQSELYLLDTQNPGHTQSIAPSQAYSETAPMWFKEQQALAFVSNRAGGVNQVFVIANDIITQVTGTSARLPEELFIPADTPLVWSPDGHRLALLAEGETEDHQRFRELIVVATDGSEIVRLTYDRADVTSPTWVTSSQLAYVLTNPDGTVRVRLTNLTGTTVTDLLEK